MQGHAGDEELLPPQSKFSFFALYSDLLWKGTIGDPHCCGSSVLMQTSPLSDALNSLASDHCTQPSQARTLVKADMKIVQFKLFILQQQCTVKQLC